MPTRREFLTTTATAMLTVSSPLIATSQREIKSSLGGVIGLQLWSLRNYLPKDLPGSLAQIRAMGFRDVEGAGLWGKTAAELRGALDKAGLRCQSAHMGYDRLQKDLEGALAEARAVGATWIVCPWIAAKISREDTLRAADVFNRAAKAAVSQGMRFGYHLHGYEFVPSTDGTLFDTLAVNTDPKQVEFQVDVFHTFHGGGDPVKIISTQKSRVTSLHLKDLKKGAPVVSGQPTGTPDIDVPVGTGQLDMPAILRAAKTAGVGLYYVEDESADPLNRIPASVKYLEGIKI
jgi:sugar phosphate isomerase/epimerase